MSLTKINEVNLQVQSNDMVNSVAISDDGSRVIAGTWFHDYSRGSGPSPVATYQVVASDGMGTELWRDQIVKCFEGIYCVGLSGNGQIAAAGGWLHSSSGLLRAYDASDGTQLLNSPPAIPQRVNSIALSADGQVLAVAADKLYVFLQQNGTFSRPPLVVPTFGAQSMTAVDVDPSGTWVVAGDLTGTIYLSILQNGAIQRTVRFHDAAVTVHHVAIARGSEFFAAVAGHFVYCLSRTSMAQNPPAPIGPKVDMGGSARWVAISADGTMIAVVANQAAQGVITMFGREGTALIPAWTQPLALNPNGVSMDARGLHVAAADGLDTGNQLGGNFYLFDSSGNPDGTFATTRMNWPIVVSTDGSGIAAGSDNGKRYLFRP